MYLWFCAQNYINKIYDTTSYFSVSELVVTEKLAINLDTRHSHEFNCIFLA